MFRIEFSRVFDLLPELKININIAIFPPSSADDPVLVRNQNTLPAEEVLKKHTIEQMTALPFWADAASIFLRTEGDTIHTGGEGRSSVERSRERPRQQTGLQRVFPLYWVQREHGPALPVRSPEGSPELVFITVRQRMVSCFSVIRGRIVYILCRWVCLNVVTWQGQR